MKHAACVLVLTLVAGHAAAQTSTVPHEPNFSVERLAPAPGPGAFLHIEDGQVAPHLGTSFTLVSTLASRPLVIRRAGLFGGEISEPVGLRLSTDLGFAIGIAGFAQAGIAVPVVAYQSGDRLSRLELMEPGSDAALAAVTVGDVRLHAKLAPFSLGQGYGYGPGLALDLVATLPTGDDSDFAGEEGLVTEARLIASWRWARFAAAVNVGPRLRSEKVRFFNPNMVLGHELAYGAAASARLPFFARRLEPMALAEVVAAWGGDDGPSPAEARLGVRARVAMPWTVGVAGGMGIGDARAIGAPAWRVALELRYDRAPRADLDDDEVPDAVDRCPDDREDHDDFEDLDGCPDADNDGDRIGDVNDQCPKVAEDRDRHRDWDGCPEPDNDEDGILDKADRCPNQAEDKDGFSDADGCPDKDNDADRVPDELDRCPVVAEDRDSVNDEDGCPDLDDDADGVPDAGDKCLTQVEDRDGWLDADGCLDADDDLDGVLDGKDRCPDAPETIRTPEDVEDDGCPDGRAMAEAMEDGTVRLSPVAQAELGGGPQVARVAVAIARAARRAGWDHAPGDVLIVTVPGDSPQWSPLADRRSNVLVRALGAAGIRARVEALRRPTGVSVRATPEAVEAGKGVKIRGK